MVIFQHQPQAGVPLEGSQAHHPGPAHDGHNLWGLGAADPWTVEGEQGTEPQPEIQGSLPPQQLQQAG